MKTSTIVAIVVGVSVVVVVAVVIPCVLLLPAGEYFAWQCAYWALLLDQN